MSERRTLVRTVLRAIPDGNGVHVTESMEVEITWPGGQEPEGSGDYRYCGDWRLLPCHEPMEKQ